MSDAAPPAPSSARRTAWKIVATVVVVVGAVSSLLYASTGSDAQYYMQVDEALPKLPSLKGKRLQIHGHAVEIEKGKKTLDYRFRIESRPPRSPGVITATFSGIVPDTFKEGAEVVVTGMLTADNGLKATEISAKCPSKYEADKPGSVPKQNAGMMPGAAVN